MVPTHTRDHVYYAHCVSIFNTPLEKRDVDLLEQLGFTVYNPNNPQDAAGYSEFGMMHFRSLVQNCDALAFRSLPGGGIPAGVFKEIQFATGGVWYGAWSSGSTMPVFELPNSITGREMSVSETREYLREVGHR